MNFLDNLLNNAGKLFGTYLETGAQRSVAKSQAAAQKPFDWKPVAYIGGGIALLLAVVFLLKK